MAVPEPASPPPQNIGLDEWTYRRGRRYGTIIVDLERYRVVDLLPDREVDTVAAWLEQHPTMELVSRDRSREVARAIAQGAPQAIQVLDRWQRLEESHGAPTAHPGPLLYRTAPVTPASARSIARRARQG
jgi:Transposase